MGPIHNIQKKADKMGGQIGLVWKTSLKSNIFSHLLNIHGREPGEAPLEASFTRYTMKKALPLVEDLRVSLVLVTQRSLTCDVLMGWANDIEEGLSDK